MHAAFPLIHPPSSKPSPAPPARLGQPAMVSTVPGTTPLVFDSPTAARIPADFRPPAACSPCAAPKTRTSKKSTPSPPPGRGLGRSPLPRIYLDANRDTLELDTTLLDAPWPDPSRRPRRAEQSAPGQGPDLEVHRRRRAHLRPPAQRGRGARPHRPLLAPYHAAVAQAIDAAHARHGYSIHINCHSMPAIRPATPPTFRAWCMPTLWWATATAPPPARPCRPW